MPIEIRFSSLVFDLDGTISDPSLGITRSFNHALKNHGLAEISPTRIQREIGPPLDHTFRKLVPGLDEADIPVLISSYRDRYAEVGYSENSVYTGIPEILDQLKNSGIPLGVCTSKRKDFAEKILSLFELEDYFEFVDGGDVGIAKRTQLSGLLETGVIDDSAVMIGDRSIDILSAHANGLRGIGVLWGFGDHQELSGASPIRILEKPAELSEVVA
jgi:phosphoglycolate phosphatase